MANPEIVEFIKNFVSENFGDDVIAIYGIGSAFESNVKANDVDAIVVLKKLDKCPHYDWTPARFEKKIIEIDSEKTEVWFLYNTIGGYMNKDVFKEMSFANWEWSVRGLRHASTLICGEDIRDGLPEPPYDYDDILIRCAYHLEPSTKWKLGKIWEEGGDPQEFEKNRLTKAVFKFGFLLVAYLYPDENAFGKGDVYDKLEEAYESDKIDGRILDFYELSINYRVEGGMQEFEAYRREFVKLMVKETIYVLRKDWLDIKALFQRAFGKKPFSNLLGIIQRDGWD